MERKEPQGEARTERLGGARADFVANLGRRVAELSAALRSWESAPTSDRARDDLRRRVHALGAGARLLRFARLAEEIQGCEKRIDDVASRGELLADDARVLKGMLERMPALAWGHTSIAEPPAPAAARSAPARPEPPRTRTLAGFEAPAGAVRPDPSKTPLGLGGVAPTSQPKPIAPILPVEAASWPLTALVVGPAQLADALTNDIASASGPAFEHGSAALEVERTDDNTIAIDLARAVAPDLVVVDADAEGARQLVLALLSDPLTEPVPVIVVGRWARPEDASPYVAMGVARAMPKPVSPDALRRACAEVAATYVRREVHKEPLGQMTLDQLGARLAEELRRGLCDAADAKGRGARVELGEGSEVLAALWGAVARIRDLVTIRSDGAVRFAPTGPEGALPLAPWLGAPEGAAGATRLPTQDARGAMAHSLEKTVMVVADDDPAVTWFLAGVLRAAGAIVHEAHDGGRALELAQHVAPDLLISDVLMPVLDGFALCRAMKRDLALRDVPVILLSWKEDLLQRVRELGADADGYLRKEASASAIVQRVREVMRPRQRVAERLAAGGEIRGRLDGLTTRTLLGLACAHRPACTLTVRDASFLYEVEIRQGRPIRATRTTTEGTFQRGVTVLAALLGVGSGRFVVAPAASEGSMRADLEGSLSDQLVAPIAAARAAQRLLSGAELVKVDRVGVDDETIAGYLAATPEPARSLLRALAGGASPRAMITTGQAAARLVEDVLCDAAAHGAIREIKDRGGHDLYTSAVEREIEVLRGVRRSLPAPAPLPPAMGGLPSFTETTAPPPVEETPFGAAVAPSFADADRPSRSARDVEAAARLAAFGDDGDGVDDAELVAAEPEPEPEPEPVVVAPRRLSPPPPLPRVAPQDRAAPAPSASMPPPPPVRESARPRPVPMMTLGSLTPPPVVERAVAEEAALPPPPAKVEPAPAPAPKRAAAPAPAEDEIARPVPRPSAYASPSKPAPKSGQQRVAMWILFAIAGLAFAFAARWAREREVRPASPPPVAAAAATTAIVEAPAPEPAPSVEPASPKESPAQDLPLRSEDKVPAGQGMLEVVAGNGNTIYVDGRMIGSGPVAKTPLAPKAKGEAYEVRVKLRGEDQVRFVVVKEGRLTRLRVAPPWSR